ncbi:hypothetical protein [Pseudoalteromonas phenolica]|nr:hypothetical protein [Pseudoalteromonas phenolica]
MRRTAIVLAITALSLSGCKTLDAVPGGLGDLVGSKQVDQAQVQAAYSKAQEAYTSAQTAMQNASSQSLSDYDPERVQDANKIWSDLQEEFAELQAKPERALDKASLFSSNTVADEVMEQSQNIIALITSAENSKNAIVAVLEPIRAHFLVLDNIETQKNFSKQYTQLVERHDELKALLIEGEQAKVEEYLPEFSQRLHNLEQDAVEQFYLGEVFSKLKSLANSEKSEVLPSVYADVKDTAETAQAFARNNVRDYDGIKDKTRLAELQIQRINSLFSEHKSREQALKSESVEAQLLALETQLFQLTQKAGLGDLRHLSFSDQLNELKKAL